VPSSPSAVPSRSSSGTCWLTHTPFHDLGPGFYTARIDPERRKRTHIRQLEALGYTVILQPAA
jgi:hypothetical protein